MFDHSHEYRLIVTPQTVREYVEVLQRPELTGKFTSLTGINVARIPDILQQAEVVIPNQEPQVSRDVKDNKFLAAAEAAKADYLISEDRDLFDLLEYKELVSKLQTHDFKTTLLHAVFRAIFLHHKLADTHNQRREINKGRERAHAVVYRVRSLLLLFIQA